MKSAQVAKIGRSSTEKVAQTCGIIYEKNSFLMNSTIAASMNTALAGKYRSTASAPYQRAMAVRNQFGAIMYGAAKVRDPPCSFCEGDLMY